MTQIPTTPNPNVNTTASAQIIDGKALAHSIQEQLAQKVADLRAHNHEVVLDAVLVAPGSSTIDEHKKSPAHIYADNQRATCERLGIEYRLHELTPNSSYEDIAGRILLLSNDDDVSAIMLHLPIPEGIDTYRIQSLIAPEKDVEGVNPANIGNIVYGRSSLVPCTALATLKMVQSTGINLQGAQVVCVGASNHVGKPIAVLMMQYEATVISCTKYTKNITDLTRTADVLIAAAGRPGLITPDHVQPGAIVIDVGVNRITDPITGKRRTVGDVDFNNVSKIASHISPVPGGVGPMTVSMLLRNVVKAAEPRTTQPPQK